MAHAATATHDIAHEAPREYSAFLRLRQGGAARATWLVTDSPGGTMISVGADSACDWQIRAAFVPPRAFSVLVMSGRAFVRSGPEPGLLVNGKPVDDSWNALPARARIDIGLARFEVRTGYGVHAEAEEPVLELMRPRRVEARGSSARELNVEARGLSAREQNAEAQVDDVQVGSWSQPVLTQPSLAQSALTQSLAQTAVVHRQPSARQPDELRIPGKRRKRILQTHDYGAGVGERVQPVGAPEAEPWGQEVRAVEPQAVVEVPEYRARPQKVEPWSEPVTPGASTRRERSSTIELRSDDLDYVGTIPMPSANAAEYVCSPSLLGSDELTFVTGNTPLWRYAAMGAFFASAYSAWLYLLDRL